MHARVGDWIVYYEPRRAAGTRGYFAVARVERIIPGPTAANMYLAIIERGSYLDFAYPVPFADAQGIVIKNGVLNEAGRISGREQAAVHGLPPADFNHVLDAGFADAKPLLPRINSVESSMAVHEERTLLWGSSSRGRRMTRTASGRSSTAPDMRSYRHVKATALTHSSANGTVRSATNTERAGSAVLIGGVEQ